MKPNELKNMRLDLNLTQYQLAKMLGYSDRSSISLLESGQRRINPRVKVALEKALMEKKND